MRLTDRPYLRLAIYLLFPLVPIYGAVALYFAARRLWFYPSLRIPAAIGMGVSVGLGIIVCLLIDRTRKKLLKQRQSRDTDVPSQDENEK